MFIGSILRVVSFNRASKRASEEGTGRFSSKEAERLCMVAPLNKFLREVEQIVNLEVSDTDSSADMRMRTHAIPLTRGYSSERSASSNPPPRNHIVLGPEFSRKWFWCNFYYAYVRNHVGILLKITNTKYSDPWIKHKDQDPIRDSRSCKPEGPLYHSPPTQRFKGETSASLCSLR